MVEQNSSLYLLVLLAISDHELHKSEAVRIKQIAEELKIEFDPYDAVAEIKSEFKNDFNTACDYYMSIIQDNRVKETSIEFMKEIAFADAKLHDTEIKFLEKCKKKWGIE